MSFALMTLPCWKCGKEIPYTLDHCPEHDINHRSQWHSAGSLLDQTPSRGALQGPDEPWLVGWREMCRAEVSP